MLGFFRILYVFCYVLVDVFSVEFLDFGVWVSDCSEVWGYIIVVFGLLVIGKG